MAIGDDDVVMGGSHTNKWKGSWALKLIGGSFLGALIFSFMALGSRSVVFQVGPATGVILVSFSTAVGWFIATSVTLKITGGFMSWSHVLGFYLVGWAASLVSQEGKDANNDANKFYSRLHALTVFVYYFFGLWAGFYIGGLVAGALISSFALANTAFIPHSPGPWPGQGVDVTDGAAFVVELILSTIMSTIIGFLYLRKQDERIPLAGAFTILALTFIGFNLTGAPLDGLLWFSAELVKCTYGTGCFTAPDTTWWWALAFGGFVGVLIGSALAYTANFFYPRVQAVLKATEGEIGNEESEPMVGAPATKAKQPRRNVAELGDSLF